MGTSKGYIAPSTPNWASAKRGEVILSLILQNQTNRVLQLNMLEQ